MKTLLKGILKLVSSPLVIILIPISLIQGFGGAEYNETLWVKYMDWFTDYK